MIPISKAWPPLKAYWKHIFIENVGGKRRTSLRLHWRKYPLFEVMIGSYESSRLTDEMRPSVKLDFPRNPIFSTLKAGFKCGVGWER